MFILKISSITLFFFLILKALFIFSVNLRVQFILCILHIYKILMLTGISHDSIIDSRLSGQLFQRLHRRLQTTHNINSHFEDQKVCAFSIKSLELYFLLEK